MMLRCTARLKRPLSRSTAAIEHLTAGQADPRILFGALEKRPCQLYHPSVRPLQNRCFSTSSGSSAKEQQHADNNNNNKGFPAAMRNLVKPFFMKCHPDVQQSEHAKQVNLVAIQNLNAFLDTMEAKLQPAPKMHKNEKTIFEVDFCVIFKERVRGKKEEVLVRRKVELAVPTQFVSRTTSTTKPEHKRKFQLQVEKQLIKLLFIAGISTPEKPAYEETTDLEDKIRRQWDEALKTGDFSKINEQELEQARWEKYQRNREAYVNSFPWKTYDKVIKYTERDLEADRITDGLIRDDPRQRMAYLADILARVRVAEDKSSVVEGDDEEREEEVDPISQLIALRRLSILMDENFDELGLEEMGRFWDKANIVLTAPREYNTSPSALYRRRKRNIKGDVMANDGFAFALHADNSCTIHIPVDFRDEELMAQLKRHVEDYVNLIYLELDGIFRGMESGDIKIQ